MNIDPVAQPGTGLMRNQLDKLDCIRYWAMERTTDISA